LQTVSTVMLRLDQCGQCVSLYIDSRTKAYNHLTFHPFEIHKRITLTKQNKQKSVLHVRSRVMCITTGYYPSRI